MRRSVVVLLLVALTLIGAGAVALATSAAAPRRRGDHRLSTLLVIDDVLWSARRAGSTSSCSPDVLLPYVFKGTEPPILGDLVNDFDFNQPPRPPVILSVHPAPGPASTPPS